MHRLLGRWQNAEEDHTRSFARDEHEAAEITIAGAKDASLFLGDAEQVGVVGSGQAEFGRGHNVMPRGT